MDGGYRCSASHNALHPEETVFGADEVLHNSCIFHHALRLIEKAQTGGKFLLSDTLASDTERGGVTRTATAPLWS